MRRASFLVSGLALVALTACLQEKKLDPNVAALTAVSTATGEGFKVSLHNNVKLFQPGPQRLTGPDSVLEKGVVVRMVRQQFGYSLVQTVSSNQLGWVANDDLAPVDAPKMGGNVLGPSGITAEGNPEAEALSTSPETDGNSLVTEKYRLDDPEHSSQKKHLSAESNPSPVPTP